LRSELLIFLLFDAKATSTTDVMVKWTSKKGKELQEQIKGVILSGDWGNIFAPGFDSKDFDYKGLRSSNSEWDEAFSAKQFQTNVKAMID